MTRWDWKARIDGMLDALGSDDAVRLRIADRGAPLGTKELRSVNKALGFELDPRFVAFFRVCNGLRVVWVGASLDFVEDPLEHYHEHYDSGLTGSINVPSLAEIFLTDHGDLFGADFCEPRQYTSDCLGGWDQHALRNRLCNIDDFQRSDHEASYHLPGLVATPRYPDPPVIMTDDYAACLEDHHPMLARDYLALVVATLGVERPRMRRMTNRGYGDNHSLFIAPEGWLDALPTAREVLGLAHGTLSEDVRSWVERRMDRLLDCEGLSVDQTPYAAYNKAPDLGVMIISDDPLEGMRRRARGDGPQDYLKSFRGPTLTIPRFAPEHYAIKTSLAGMENLEALGALIGQPIKVTGDRRDKVGCLISLSNDGVGTLYNESGGGYGTTGFSLVRAEDVGRAWCISYDPRET